MFLIIPFFLTSLGLVSSAPGPYEDSLSMEDILSFRGSEEGPNMTPEEGASPSLLFENKESSKVEVIFLVA